VWASNIAPGPSSASRLDEMAMVENPVYSGPGTKGAAGYESLHRSPESVGAVAAGGLGTSPAVAAMVDNPVYDSQGSVVYAEVQGRGSEA
jgi:hypothetical protein